MKKKLLLVVNPNSGDGIAKRWVYDMVERLSGVYKFVTVYLSRCTGDIKKIVSEYANEYDSIIGCGGDGTLNEIINGMYESGNYTEIGYIPTGTVNDFASSHKIPKTIKLATEKLLTAKPFEYDAGLLGNMAYSYVAAFGAFTEVSYMTPQNAKASLGIAAYVAEAALKLSELKPIEVTCDYGEGAFSGDYIFGMVTNSITVGGIKFFDWNDKEILSDGKLETTLVRYPQNGVEIQDAIKGLLTPGYKTPMVERVSAKKVKFSFDKEVPWTTDGEFGGNYTEVEVGVLPHKITVLE